MQIPAKLTFFASKIRKHQKTTKDDIKVEKKNDSGS